MGAADGELIEVLGDLKPANIKVTPEGKVKVLDFGLAKAFAGEAAASDPAQSPTISAAATRAGTHPWDSGQSQKEIESGGVTIAQAGVPVGISGTLLRLYVETAGTFGEVGSIQTGLALGGARAALPQAGEKR